MRYVHRKGFVKLKYSRSHHSRFGDLNSRRIISFLRIVKGIVELVLMVVQVLRYMLGTAFRRRVSVVTNR